MKALLEKIRKLLKDRRFRQLWYRSVSAFAAVVVFITTYALVLPAITLEKTAACGIEEHQHDESCYESRLVCGQEESEGHHHDDSCYSITKELVCDLEEHEHSEENGCYDEEGNLICKTPGHTHSASCFKESKTLTCGQEEREGHHHTDACYEKVLVCGKESHIHSAECYKEDSSAVAATDEAAGSASTVTSGESDPSGSDAMPGENAEDGTSGTTDATEEPAVFDPSVPQLDPVDLDAVMTKDTGFYYFHAEEGEDIPANSAEITDWQKVKKDTELSSTDLVKAYFAYKIPAGSLNESNTVARYRLPGNIHLTDDQIEAINLTENGVYTSLDSEEEARKYLGAEAIEGSRKPDEELVDGVQEYISAIVRAENIFDEEGSYLGQDLIFTFVPYTIEKNQNTYDADGSQLTAGEKITGWFACDFNMSQIDWVEEESDLDNSTAEKSAEVIFVEEDREIGTKEISTVLNLVETIGTGGNSEDASSESSEETAEAAAAEVASTEEESAEEASSADETASDTELTKTPEYKSGTLTADGDGYKITLDYTEEARIPENAELSVKEITPETDKEAYEACLEQAKKQVAGGNKSAVDQAASRFFDIEIVVRSTGDGDDEGDSLRKIEPAAPVSVNIQITDTNTNAEAVSESGKAEQNDPTVLHFAEEGVEQIDSTVKESKEEKSGEGQSTEVQFEAESFSVYGVVYTVDFKWEVDGDTFEYSLAGGDSVSFRKLVEVLGVMDDTAVSAADNSEKSSSHSTIDEFIDDVEKVEFSDESLVKVARITEGITAGALKEKFEIESEYSAELTETQIEEINSQVFYAPDWALISLKAFTSEEYLTVTMKTGEVFTIAVTDEQIKKTVIDAKGDTWEVTVTYDDEAGIPDGADLEVEELAEGTAEYQKYLKDSVNELRTEADDISFARFFDITIVDKDGNKVEPETPVTVQIEYKDAIEIGEKEHLSVVHFAEKGTEVIDNINLNEACTTVTYTQDSFSVTGTVVNSAPRNGQSYMLIVDYEGEKYIINNDGTLVPVSTINNSEIETDYPMLWTYNYQYGGNFRIASEATGFDANNVAVGFYYRYIDPNVDSGLTEEDAQHPNLAGSTQVNYNNNFISSASNNNLYIGISDEGGTLHIVGNQHGASKAAKITLYNPGNVRSADPANHSVNHIDVSISGDADIDVPLAYGIYYYKEGDTWHKLIVGADVPDVTGDGVSPENTTRVDNHTENLKAENVHVTSTDMKSATITAKRHDTGAVVNDAFYITGYSANHSTQYSTDQVRIEGSFKVADMAPVNNDYWTVNSYDTRSRRLQNIIDYTVSADKRLNLPLTYTVGGNSYALYKDPLDDADQVSVVATVNLSATFNYWDHAGDNNPANDGNECPPLQPEWGYDYEWKNGGIHPYGISGMDFVLHGKGTTAAKILAIEITKTLKFLDEDGSVESVQYNQPITFDYEVFTDQPGDPSTVRVPGGEVHDYGTYKALNSTEITVRPTTDGSNSGHVYDYDVTDGMYYVREVRDDNFPTELTIGGDTYRYVSTNIKTEYSYRHNQYRDRETGYHQMHEVGISSETADLNSIPEVLGTYTADDGQEENNEFLEYYFENVYQKNATPPPPEPITETMEINLDKKWQDGDDTTAPAEGSVTFYLRRKVVQNGHETEDTSFNNQNNKYVVSAVDGWKLTIPNLVWHETDTHGTFDRIYKYYFEEDTAQAVGDDVERYGVPSFTNGYGSVNSPVEGGNEAGTVTVECTNKTGNVLRIQKRWLNVDPDVAPPVTLRIWRQQVEVGQWGASAHGSPEAYNYNGTNNIIVLDNTSRVPGTNWWQLEIPLPTDKGDEYYRWNGTENVLTNYEYAYYISEDSLNIGSEDYLAPQFYKLLGDEVVDDYDAWGLTNPNTGNAQGMGFNYRDWGNHQSHPETYVTTAEGKDGTLIVMNAPKTAFHHVVFEKEWYKYDQNGQLVKAGSNDVKNYAVGIQIYQRIKSPDNNGEWHTFAKPIYLGAPGGIIDNNGNNYIMDENNPFVFEGGVSENNGAWRWQLIDNASKTGFPTYAEVDGRRVYYEYEAREIGVYTTIDGVNKASSADQLQRVFDYTNTQEWSFDYQHKQPEGINVEAGKLKVTKNWQGGHEGSRIYFKLFRNGTDITDDVISDPENYGLNEFQVYDDGTHKALFVAYDGTSWDQNYVIQGLPIGPSGGGSLYKYSIQEIGYSEADGTNCWDNETITNSDGSTRTDPHGQTVTVDIDADLLVGYKVDNGTVSKNSDGKSGEAVLTELPDNAPHSIEVYNNYVEKYKDFEFSKVWENGAGEFQTWPADISSIKVDLYAKAGTGEPVKIKEGIDFYVTPPTQDSKQEFTWNGVTYKWEVSVDASGKIYTFKIPDLPAKDSYPNGNDYEYSVVEQSVTDYITRYGHNVEEQKTVEVTDEGGNTVYEEDGVTPKTKTVTVKSFVAEEADSASNGKVISNKKDEPQTGTLNITKAVSEGADASGKTFRFEVTFKNTDDTAFTDAVNVTDSTRQTATSVTPDNLGKIVVTVTGTGTAVITDIPDGIKYTVSEPTSTIPSGWKQEGTVAVTGGNADQTIAAGETETATITNTPTDFEFSKVWKNANGTQYDTWQKDITVTLYRKSKKSDSVEETVKVFSIANGAASINSELNTSYNAEISITGSDAPETGKENKGYKYTITGAGLAAYDSEGYEYDYYVKEADVTFYTTTYGVFDGEGDTRTPRAVDGYSSAADGGVIINTPVEAVELPSTGGSGTHLIYILGSALTIFAAALLGIRRIRHGQ